MGWAAGNLRRFARGGSERVEVRAGVGAGRDEAHEQVAAGLRHGPVTERGEALLAGWCDEDGSGRSGERCLQLVRGQSEQLVGGSALIVRDAKRYQFVELRG